MFINWPEISLSNIASWISIKYEPNSADVSYAPQKYRYIFTPKQFLKFVVKYTFSEVRSGGLAYWVALLPRVSSPKKNFVHPPKKPGLRKDKV